jgi:outer membrane protein assembly factor BamB
VDGKHLFALGSDGDLVCLEIANGKEVWRKHLRTDFGGKYGEWAYSESPLVDGDKVIVTPGGTNATVVALNKKTGDVGLEMRRARRECGGLFVGAHRGAFRA